MSFGAASKCCSPRKEIFQVQCYRSIIYFSKSMMYR
jgi:hypothetical protein